ncbi:MAG TPA: DsbA family protein [Rickettsiales bacterium]|nr:DsbA family protein [Rickettsiales bacterium]
MHTSLAKFALSALASGALLLSSTASLAQEKSLSKAEVEAIVKQVIRDNPEMILQSVTDYQKKKQAEAAADVTKNLPALKGQLQEDPLSPFVGNPKGDVTVVEFFDYHCGYCKRFLPVIAQLLESDKKVKMVFKEFPILSDDSTLAAKAALAVNKIDKSKYLAFHSSLMEMTTAFTMENLTQKAQELGIDPAVLKKTMESPDIEKEIAQTRELALNLDIHGTPALVIGTHIIPGVVPLSDLQSTIDSVRKGK